MDGLILEGKDDGKSNKAEPVEVFLFWSECQASGRDSFPNETSLFWGSKLQRLQGPHPHAAAKRPKVLDHGHRAAGAGAAQGGWFRMELTQRISTLKFQTLCCGWFSHQKRLPTCLHLFYGNWGTKLSIVIEVVWSGPSWFLASNNTVKIGGIVWIVFTNKKGFKSFQGKQEAGLLQLLLTVFFACLCDVFPMFSPVFRLFSSLWLPLLAAFNHRWWSPQVAGFPEMVRLPKSGKVLQVDFEKTLRLGSCFVAFLPKKRFLKIDFNRF